MSQLFPYTKHLFCLYDVRAALKNHVRQTRFRLCPSDRFQVQTLTSPLPDLQSTMGVLDVVPVTDPSLSSYEYHSNLPFRQAY
jgi:hypothetical protein